MTSNRTAEVAFAILELAACGAPLRFKRLTPLRFSIEGETWSFASGRARLFAPLDHAGASATLTMSARGLFDLVMAGQPPGPDDWAFDGDVEALGVFVAALEPGVSMVGLRALTQKRSP